MYTYIFILIIILFFYLYLISNPKQNSYKRVKVWFNKLLEMVPTFKDLKSIKITKTSEKQ
jgi:hypothetical protein